MVIKELNLKQNKSQTANLLLFLQTLSSVINLELIRKIFIQCGIKLVEDLVFHQLLAVFLFHWHFLMMFLNNFYREWQQWMKSFSRILLFSKTFPFYFHYQIHIIITLKVLIQRLLFPMLKPFTNSLLIFNRLKWRVQEKNIILKLKIS